MTYLIAAYLIAIGLVVGLAVSLVYRYRKATQELAALEAADDHDAGPAVTRPA
ncbi:MAG: heme exporter protein CcmD [Anaerolineae bacterium]|nr:MAG: heme exporter protein CcmD [Anaerolineae bacterium]